MLKKFNKKKLISIGIGILLFAVFVVFGDSLPFLKKTSLPPEVKEVIDYAGITEDDISEGIRNVVNRGDAKDGSDGDANVVTKIIDGDTIEIDGGTLVRYIGIDAPEQDSRFTEAECWNKEATARNSELVMGKRVRLETDVSETDSFGRLLRYVYVDDIFVNEALVRDGYAHAIQYPPDVRESSLLSNAEKEAREKNSGLWSACDSN